MRLRHLPLIVTLGFLVAACGASEDTPAADVPVDVLTIQATDSLRFEPAEATIVAGTEVSVTLSAGAAVEHDLVLADAADRGMVGADGHGSNGGGHMMDASGLHVVHAEAGMTESTTMMIDTPGTYEAYCSVPGHREAGMTMVLHVVAAS